VGERTLGYAQFSVVLCVASVQRGIDRVLQREQVEDQR
jgi:hypothetical protein